MVVTVLSAAVYVPPRPVQAAVNSATVDDVVSVTPDTRDAVASHDSTSSLSSRPDAVACQGT